MGKPNYNSPNDLAAMLDARGLGMRKRHGQNFMINPDARNKLLNAFAVEKDEAVWEIGPGIGAMTESLLERGAIITAYEIDPGFCKILLELFGANNNFNLIEGDILKTWHAKKTDNISMFGNLPYNIASVLLADFINKKQFFKKMVITVQLETAQRLLAKPGTGDYSSLTVLCSSVYKITPLSVIKGSSFYPAPKVDSQGLRFDLLENRKEPPMYFSAILRSLFVSRRKTIRNNLFNFVSSVIIKDSIKIEDTIKIKDTMDAKNVVSEVLELSDISGNRRAETLETEDFFKLAKNLEDVIKNGK